MGLMYIAHADSMSLTSTSIASNPGMSSRSVRRFSVKSARESFAAAIFTHSSSQIANLINGQRREIIEVLDVVHAMTILKQHDTANG